MYLRRNKSRGRVYYQVFSNDKKFLLQLGSIEKIVDVFSFFKKFKGTVSELIQLGVVDGDSGRINRLVTEKINVKKS